MPSGGFRTVRVVTILVLFTSLLCGCVSRSGFQARLSESKALAAPPINVTLSDPEHYSFAMVGDLHIGGQDTSRLRTILQEATNEGDAFIILLGDLVDKGAREDFVAVQSAIDDLGWSGKTFTVLGNHDIFYDGWTHYKELLGPSYYTFEIGNATFIVLDTADGAVGKFQRDWLKEKLKAKTTTNTFILSHYLPLVPGIQTYLKLANEVEASQLMNLARIYGVTGWFGGHYHSYVMAQIEGTDYVVAGGGGGKRMDPVPRYFFVQVTVVGSEVSYELRLMD